MIWIAGFIVLLLLGVLFMTGGGRALALGLVVLVAALGIFHLAEETEERASHLHISPKELTFEKVTLIKSDGGTNYELAGHIKNNSRKFTLTHLDIVVTMQECPGAAPKGNCVTLGEGKVSIDEHIQAGQDRDFKRSVYLGTFNPQGHLNWNYTVSEITADVIPNFSSSLH
jgi:hypothetical protein